MFGFAIFALLHGGEFCPYHFTGAFPDGITRGSAHVYLRPDYPRQHLAEVIANRTAYHASRHDDSFREWFASLCVRAIPLNRDQYLELWDMDKVEKPLPECYRAIWVGGWETPAKGKEAVTFAA